MKALLIHRIFKAIALSSVIISTILASFLLLLFYFPSLFDRSAFLAIYLSFFSVFFLYITQMILGARILQKYTQSIREILLVAISTWLVILLLLWIFTLPGYSQYAPCLSSDGGITDMKFADCKRILYEHRFQIIIPILAGYASVSIMLTALVALVTYLGKIYTVFEKWVQVLRIIIVLSPFIFVIIVSMYPLQKRQEPQLKIDEYEKQIVPSEYIQLPQSP